MRKAAAFSHEGLITDLGDANEMFVEIPVTADPKKFAESVRQKLHHDRRTIWYRFSVRREAPFVLKVERIGRWDEEGEPVSLSGVPEEKPTEGSAWDGWWVMVEDCGYAKGRYTHLSADEEECVVWWEKQGIAMTEIARFFGISLSYVKRLRDGKRTGEGLSEISVPVLSATPVPVTVPNKKRHTEQNEQPRTERKAANKKPAREQNIAARPVQAIARPTVRLVKALVPRTEEYEARDSDPALSETWMH